MILNKKETALAYRCPECGTTVMSIVGIFSLSGDMLKLRCSCHQSELSLSYTSDKKIRLSVPCIACPKPHNFIIGQTTFFERDKDVFRLPCPYTGVDICFIGEQNSILTAIDTANEELLELMKGAELDDLSKIRTKDDIENEDELKSENPLIEDIVAYMIKDLENDGAIHCKCEDGKGVYTYRLHHGRVTIRCAQCNAMITMPMSGTTSAENFLDCASLNLE